MKATNYYDASQVPVTGITKESLFLKYLPFSLLFFLLCIAGFKTNAQYSELKGDTLTIGNRFIERKFFWNKGNLITCSIVDKIHHQLWPNNNKTPDFSVSKIIPEASNATYSTSKVNASAIKPASFETTVCFFLGALQVKRIFRVFENSPVIVCDTYLKGQMDPVAAEQNTNSGDRKNIEFIEDMGTSGVDPVLDQIKPGGFHWQCRAVEFLDVTDWNNNLVLENTFIPYRKKTYRGNLLFMHNLEKEAGLFFLKEAPGSSVQLAYNGKDFTTEFGHFAVNGLGLTAGDVKDNEWRKTYSTIIGVYAGGQADQLKALRSYQKNIRTLLPARDEMVMMNTWGDRSQDSKINEKFSLLELERAAQLGITHFQIDDGWQIGKSPNSALAEGSFKNIWDNPDYWKPDPAKYPNGLAPIVKRGKELGVKICLWFNPSVQNDYADWEKDVAALVNLYREYGIHTFKIDGLAIPNKQSEINLNRLFDQVLVLTDNQVVFNLDATAGRRGGYHTFTGYGNIFLENRYTDWQNYYPHWTLRNLWQLSKYVPAEKLQIEFLNKWRNTDHYGQDIFAPANYSFEYLFACTMAAQPLAWFEGTGLPEEALKISGSITAYKKIQHDFHQGTILPIGDEPSGRSWTGFQSMNNQKGYFIFYRENNPKPVFRIETWLPENTKVKCTPLLGNGKGFIQTAGFKGTLKVELPDARDFVLYRYEIIP